MVACYQKNLYRNAQYYSMNKWIQDLSRCSSSPPQKLIYLNSLKCCPSASKASLIHQIATKTFVECRCIALPIYYIHYDSRFVIFLWRTWYLSADYVQLCIIVSNSNRHEKSISSPMRPDWLWGLVTFLFNGYLWPFPREQRSRSDNLKSHYIVSDLIVK